MSTTTEQYGKQQVNLFLMQFCDVNRCDPSTRRKFSMWYITGCETDVS